MIPEVPVTPEVVAAIAGILLSLAFSWIPKLNTEFAKLERGQKQLIMVGVLFVTTALLFGLGCFSLIVIPGFVCTEHTALEFFWMFVAAAVSNQTTFSLTPTTKAVIAAKAGRTPSQVE